MKYTQSKGQDTGRRRAMELIEASKPTQQQMAAMPVKNMSRREKRPVPSRRAPSDYRAAQSGHNRPMPGTGSGRPAPVSAVVNRKNSADAPHMPTYQKSENGTSTYNTSANNTSANNTSANNTSAYNMPTNNKQANNTSANGAAPNRGQGRHTRQGAASHPSTSHDGAARRPSASRPSTSHDGAARRPYRYTYRDAVPRGVPDSEIVARHSGNKNTSEKASGEGERKKKSTLFSRMTEPLRDALHDGAEYAAGAAAGIKTRLGGISVNGEGIAKAAVLSAIMILALLVQTTFCHRFPFFGAVPDLMLSFVIAVGVAEGERWGGVFGLAAAFIIEAVGSTGLTLLPLLYMPLGYVCGMLSRYYLTGKAAVRGMYTLGAAVLRGAVTMIYAAAAWNGPDMASVFLNAVLPEAAITVMCAVPMHLSVWFAMHFFHKTREQRVLD